MPKFFYLNLGNNIETTKPKKKPTKLSQQKKKAKKTSPKNDGQICNLSKENNAPSEYLRKRDPTTFTMKDNTSMDLKKQARINLQ